MDKSWISKPRNTSEYVNGLLGFLDFAFANGSSDNRIRCPCSDCKCIEWQLRAVVYDHLLVRPFPKGYTIWLLHGERDIGGSSTQQEIQHNSYTEDSMRDLIKDAFNKQGHHGNVEPVAQDEVNNNDRVEGNQTDRVGDHLTDEARQVNELIRDGEQELYEGCTKFSKLSFLIKLYHIKCMTMMTDKSLSMIIELLHDAFAGFAAVPTSLYEAKKTIKKLGLSYEKIHACPNNCMLYRGTNKDLESYEKCGTSRWHTKKKTQAAKVLRYFPLIPRLQRLFMSRKTSEDMRWHDVGGNKDGLLRHPRDGESWKKFDLRYPEFAKESRNIRLGFASDGFNPFGNMSTNYSIWPVVLIPYNTAPWICMRQTSFLLSMIIPGSKMPGNDIDIYLQPLIDELKELWVGVQTFDTLRNETFNMRAALMWTVSDFPGLGILSGWNIHKGLACPVCNHDAEVCRLPHSAKWCFFGTRRFLKPGHKFRLDKVRFNGKVDNRLPPPRLSGSEIWKQVENIENSFGKAPEVPRSEKRRRTQENVIPVTHNWTKQNVFFQLVYWKFHLLPHNLDLMHIEKNVCDNVIFTLLNETGKSKDHLKARKDLEAMGIREDLWPDENGKYKSAIFTMSPKQKDLFLTTLKNIRVPDGYSSNISRCVDLKQRKLFGLKSHDCHILMEQLLPIALRNVMPGIVCAVITDLCSFFQKLTSKVIDPTDLDNLQDQIVLTLCHMEMIFPPSFFTVMIHLVVHLVEEVKLGGPESYRWMYFMER